MQGFPVRYRLRQRMPSCVPERGSTFPRPPAAPCFQLLCAILTNIRCQRLVLPNEWAWKVEATIFLSTFLLSNSLFLFLATHLWFLFLKERVSCVALDQTWYIDHRPASFCHWTLWWPPCPAYLLSFSAVLVKRFRDLLYARDKCINSKFQAVTFPFSLLFCNEE